MSTPVAGGGVDNTAWPSSREYQLLRRRHPVPPFDDSLTFVDHAPHTGADGLCTEHCHAYYDRGARVRGSTTGFIGHQMPDFDAVRISEAIVRSRRYREDPEYKYHGMTAEQIRSMWEANAANAADQGTQMHDAFEAYYNGELAEDDPRRQLPEFKQFERFDRATRARGWIPWRTELRMRDRRVSGLCGSADMLYLRVRDGALILVDWKRPAHLCFIDTHAGFGRAPRFCLAPMHMLQVCDGSKYIAQLNLYRRYMEDGNNNDDTTLDGGDDDDEDERPTKRARVNNTDGNGVATATPAWRVPRRSVVPRKVAKMFIVTFHPTQSDFNVHRVPSMRGMADALRHKRRVELETEATATAAKT